MTLYAYISADFPWIGKKHWFLSFMATDDAVTFTHSRENLSVSKATATLIGM